jgi:hypothetical protein
MKRPSSLFISRLLLHSQRVLFFTTALNANKHAKFLDGSVIADFESLFFVHHCQLKGACLIILQGLDFERSIILPTYSMVVELATSLILKPHHRLYVGLSSLTQLVWGTEHGTHKSLAFKS